MADQDKPISYAVKVSDEAGPNTDKKLREVIDEANRLKAPLVEAHSMPVAKITPGGVNGFIQWGADGRIVDFRDPT